MREDFINGYIIKKKIILAIIGFMFFSNIYAQNISVGEAEIEFQGMINQPQATEKHIQWQGIQSHQPNGITINVAMFNSDLSAVDTASLINKLHPVFQKVLTLPDRVVLSGMHKNLHWLADINAFDKGATGYVSSLNPANTNLD